LLQMVEQGRNLLLAIIGMGSEFSGQLKARVFSLCQKPQGPPLQAGLDLRPPLCPPP
jgi:hypothetical protein